MRGHIFTHLQNLNNRKCNNFLIIAITYDKKWIKEYRFPVFLITDNAFEQYFLSVTTRT